MGLSSARIKAYARTMDAGLRTIEEVQEEYQVTTYVELVSSYNWKVEGSGEKVVDPKYQDRVKNELTIIS